MATKGERLPTSLDWERVPQKNFPRDEGSKLFSCVGVLFLSRGRQYFWIECALRRTENRGFHFMSAPELQASGNKGRSCRDILGSFFSFGSKQKSPLVRFSLS